MFFLIGMLLGASGGFTTYTILGKAGLVVAGKAVSIGAGTYIAAGTCVGGTVGGVADILEKKKRASLEEVLQQLRSC